MYAYRLTVYVGKSVDPTETTVLTPAAGAPHTDAFRVATVPNVAGFQPYIAAAPRGRKGRINVLTRATDTGELTIALADVRIGGTGGNLQRWVSAFVGNAKRLLQLKGRRVIVEEAADWDPVAHTGTWVPYFTGRIYTAKLDGRLKVALQIRDTSQDLETDVFVGHPDPTLTQAFRASLIPLGLPYRYGFIDTQQRIAPWLQGHVQPDQAGVSGAPGRVNIDNVPDRLRFMTHAAGAVGDFGWLVVLRNAAGQIGFFGSGIIDRQKGGNKVMSAKRFATGFNVAKTPLPGSTMTAWPASGTAVQLYATAWRGAPDDAIPLLIDDIHPVTLWRWLLEGRFGYFDATGTPAVKIPYNAAAFAALEADATLATMRFCLTGSQKLNKFVEESICLPRGLAWYINAAGEVVPVDLRLTAASATGAVTLTSADVIAGETPTWTSGQDAVSRVDVTYYLDQMPARVDAADSVSELYPDIPPIQQAADQVQVGLNVEGTALDAGGAPLQLKIAGARLYEDDSPQVVPGTVLETTGGMNRRDWLLGQFAAMEKDITRLFGVGAIYAGLTVARNARTLSIQPGQFVILTVDELLDPATNQRGGGRLGLCTERSEQGPHLGLTFLDAGEATQTGAPGWTSFTQNAADGRHSADYVVTRAAADDTLTIEVCVTPSGQLTAPAAGDAGWVVKKVLNPGDSLSGTLTNLPGGMKVWPRLRALRTSAAQRFIPSAYVAGPAVVMQALIAPSALAFTGATKNGGHLAWTPGEPTMNTEVLVAAGVTAPTGLATEALTMVGGGDASADLVGLSGPSVQQTLGLRHSDRLGSQSTIATLTVTTGTANTQAPRPAGIAVR